MFQEDPPTQKAAITLLQTEVESLFFVADGQCMIIVEQGKIVEVCAEPGQFTFDSSHRAIYFTGSLGSSIEATFATIGKNDSPMAEIPEKIREYIISIQKS